MVIEFLDEEIEVGDSESLTFGRDARLVIDPANQYLHRVLGSFVQQGDTWMLHNVGRFIALVVTDGTTRTEISPGGMMALAPPSFTVSFSAGGANYALTGYQAGAESLSVVGLGATDTTEVSHYRLNEEQRQLVVSLAEPLLNGDESWPASMPTNRDVADALGWSPTKLNRKLDYLCRRVADRGVGGVHGDSNRRAHTRRLALVEYLVGNRLVTAEDLALIHADRSNGPGDARQPTGGSRG